jgi:hypothetical protein
MRHALSFQLFELTALRSRFISDIEQKARLFKGIRCVSDIVVLLHNIVCGLI